MYEKGETEYNYFSGLGYTWYTMFQMTTFDNWSDITREVMKVYPASWIIFIFFVILSAIIVSSLVLAVICECYLSSHNSEHLKNISKSNCSMVDNDKLGIFDNHRLNALFKDLPLSSRSKAVEKDDTFEFQSFVTENCTENSIIVSVEMRKKVQAPDVHDDVCCGFLDKSRTQVGEIINYDPVIKFFLLMIAINTLLMMLSTFNFVQDNPNNRGAFDILDYIFLSIFTLESALHLFHRGRNFFKTPGLVFDLIIVAISWIPGVLFLRAMRSIRLLSLIRRIDCINVMLEAMAHIIPTLKYIVFLYLLQLYIFALIFTSLFKDKTLEGPQYFSTLHGSLFTLFQVTTLEDWASVGRDAGKVIPWSPILLIVFVIISQFILMNLIIGGLCETINISNDLKLEKELKKSKNRENNVKVVADDHSNRILEARRILEASKDEIQGWLDNL